MITVNTTKQKMGNDWSLASQACVSHFLFQPIPSKGAYTVVILKEIYTGSCISVSGRLCF